MKEVQTGMLNKTIEVIEQTNSVPWTTEWQSQVLDFSKNI